MPWDTQDIYLHESDVNDMGAQETHVPLLHGVPRPGKTLLDISDVTVCIF